MRVMVTGAGGMLADAVGPVLARAGDDTCGIFYSAEEQANFKQRFGAGAIQQFGPNLDGYAKVEALFARAREFAPDWILHCAAWTDVDGCEDDPKRAWESNALAVLEVALVARERKCRLLVVSTDYVFDGAGSSPYAVDAEPNPISEYGRSKLGGERFARLIDDHVLIVRTSWLFGPPGKNFVSTIRGRVVTGRSSQVVNDQFGRPTYTLDLAEALRSLMSEGAEGIFHVCNAGQTTWYDFALEIARYYHKPELVSPIGSDQLVRRAARPKYSVLDTSRYSETTGRCLRDWREALGHYLDQSSETPA